MPIIKHDPSIRQIDSSAPEWDYEDCLWCGTPLEADYPVFIHEEHDAVFCSRTCARKFHEDRSKPVR